MSATLSTADVLVSELVARGWSRDVALAEVRRQFGMPPADALSEDALEDEHVAAGVKIMLALGFEHVSYSQKKRAKVTPGIPDHRFYHRARRLFVWWESKASWGRQSPAQRNYQEMCDACGDPYVLGGVDAIRQWLIETGVTDADGEPIPLSPTKEH